MKKFILFCLLMVCFYGLQAQTIIYVKAGTAGNGTSWSDACDIEYAVNNASAGSQIWVQAGTYHPAKMLKIPKSVELYGGFVGTEVNLSQRDYVVNQTIIDAQDKYGSVFRLGVSAVLDGFTVQGGRAEQRPHKNGGGVWMDAYSKVENCSIVNNKAVGKGGGIYTVSPVYVINTTVSGNIANVDPDYCGTCISLTEEACIAPTITSHPNTTDQVRERNAGEPDVAFSSLSVSVAGTAPFTYQWYSNYWGGNNSGSIVVGATSPNYTPSNATIGMRDYYYCKISNSCGTVTSNVSGLHEVISNGCNANTPGWGAGLGTVTWGGNTDIEAQTWLISGNGISQVWSAPVKTSICSAKGAGTMTGNYVSIDQDPNNDYRHKNADCRSNAPGFENSGDLFSWCAVVRFKDQLCPSGWRVPTKQDFMNLDLALGGTGGDEFIGRTDLALLPEYIGNGTNQWGSSYGGNCWNGGELRNQGEVAFYWSQTGYYSGDVAYGLLFDLDGNIFFITDVWGAPGVINDRVMEKGFGGTVRCVRD